jgi:hypothetical protein
MDGWPEEIGKGKEGGDVRRKRKGKGKGTWDRRPDLI